METARIAQIIDEMGTLLEIKGENPFRCRAYHTAAQSLGNLPADLPEMIADGSLKEVPGIGETMYSKIVQLATTGQLPAYDELQAEHAAGPGRLVAHPGSGAEEDQGAARRAQDREPGGPPSGGRVGEDRQMKGFGEKTAGEYPRGDQLRREVGRADLAEHGPAAGGADHRAVESSSRGHSHRGLRQSAAAGRDDRRSGRSVQLEERSRRARRVCQAARRWRRCWPHGPTKASVRLAEGVQCDLRGVEDAQFPFALHYFTGSKAHNIAMRKRAIARGLSR